MQRYVTLLILGGVRVNKSGFQPFEMRRVIWHTRDIILAPPPPSFARGLNSGWVTRWAKVQIPARDSPPRGEGRKRNTNDDRGVRFRALSAGPLLRRRGRKSSLINPPRLFSASTLWNDDDSMANDYRVTTMSFPSSRNYQYYRRVCVEGEDLSQVEWWQWSAVYFESINLS